MVICVISNREQLEFKRDKELFYIWYMLHQFSNSGFIDVTLSIKF